MHHYLKLISFLQLICVLIFAVVHLLSLDVGVHPLLLHIGPRQVEVSICLVVALQCPLTCPKCLETQQMEKWKTFLMVAFVTMI